MSDNKEVDISMERIAAAASTHDVRDLVFGTVVVHDDAAIKQELVRMYEAGFKAGEKTHGR